MAQQGHERLGYVDHTEEVDGKRRAYLLSTSLGRQRVEFEKNPGVVHKHVETVGLGLQTGDSRVDLGFAGDIELQEADVAAAELSSSAAAWPRPSSRAPR